MRWELEKIEGMQVCPFLKEDRSMKNKIPEEIISEIFPRKVKRSKLSEEVYDRLKKMILAGKFEKGERLTEERLAFQFNVSRNPVQIALRRLRKEKLVIWRYRRGTYVA